MTAPGVASGAEGRTDRRGKDVVIAFLVGLIAIALLLLLNGGHPYSNWFYAVAALAFVPGAYHLIVTRNESQAGDSQRVEHSKALRESVLQGFATGVWMYAFMVTGMGAFYQWPPAIIVAAISGVQRYDAMVGNLRSWKAFIVGGIVFSVTFTAIVLWEISRR